MICATGNIRMINCAATNLGSYRYAIRLHYIVEYRCKRETRDRKAETRSGGFCGTLVALHG